MTDDTTSTAPPETHSVYDVAIRLGVLGLVIYFSIRLVEPFVMILLWAATLAVALYPVFAWLRDRLGGRGGLSATLITLFGLGIIIGPVSGLSLNLASSLQWLVAEIRAGTLTLPDLPQSLADIPLLGPKLAETWDAASSNIAVFLTENKDVVLGFGGWLLRTIAGLGGSVLALAVSVIVAGFLFIPGQSLVASIQKLSTRIAGERGETFVSMAGATVRNVSRGVIGIAVLQTLLAGLAFMIAGLPGAGVACATLLVLCIVQIGPLVVIIPVLIWAWSTMLTVPALLLTVYLIPVALLDNVLKPMMMSRGLETPTLVILIGVVGGTIGYGMIGLFVGPVLLGIFYDIAIVWVSDDAKDSQPGT